MAVRVKGSEITDLSNNESHSSFHSQIPNDGQVRALIGDALSNDSGLSPMKGFKLDLSANPGFRKFFYSARCECGTAALLSVEVASDKTLANVNLVLPELIRRLESQAESFYRMSCEVHKTLRMGPTIADRLRLKS